MNEDILKKLQGISVPQDVPVEGLRSLYESLGKKEGEVKPKLSPEELNFLKLLGVEEPERINIKYLINLVYGWIDVRSKNEIHVEESEVSDTNGGDLKEKLEKYEERLAEARRIKGKAKTDTRNTLDRKQKIVDEQKRIQEELRKAKEAEEKVKGKKIYASVEAKNKHQVNEDSKEKYEALKSESVESLSKKIEDKLSDGSLQTADQREKEVLARSIAVGIMAQVVNPNLEHTINSKVLQTVGESNIFENLIETDLINTAKNGAISIAINERSQIALGRRAVSHLYGEDVSEMLFGPEDIVVTLTIEQQQNSSHEIDTGAVNSNYEKLLTKQSEALDEVNSSSNPESTIVTRVVSFTREKEEKIEGKLKKLSETEKIEAIIKRFGLDKPSKRLMITEIDVNPWVDSVLNKKTPLSVAVEQTTVTSIASPIVSVISKTLLNTAGKEVVKKITLKEAAAVVLGGLNPLQTALAMLGTKLISKISQWIKKNPEAAALIFGGLAFLGTLPLFGPLIALGITSVVVAATIGVGITTAAVLGTLNLVRFVWSRIIISLAGPMFVVFVVIPILTAFVLFIINSGAYVVPPSPLSLSNGGADNPYMLVTKTANPTKLDNSGSNQTVIYVVSVKALKGNLTNLKLVSAECNVIKKDKTEVDCPTEFVPDLVGSSITPGNEGVFSFTGIYDSKYSDSLIYDKITISAINEAGEEITASGSASVCIGDCPTDCLRFEGNWPDLAQKNMQAARDYILANNSEYVIKVCAEYPNGLPLQYGGTNGDLWGYFKGTYLLFYTKGLSSINDAIYVLSHEMLHALVSEANAISIYLKYISTPNILLETPRCFYSYDSILLEERLAETVAFSIIPNRFCSITGKNSDVNQWPKHRDFVLENVLK